MNNMHTPQADQFITVGIKDEQPISIDWGTIDKGDVEEYLTKALGKYFPKQPSPQSVEIAELLKNNPYPSINF